MIDYHKLASSCSFYEDLGWQRIESPWTVSQYVSDITRPENSHVQFELKHNNKRLVASAEQSFLYLCLKEFLPLGQYQSITPCFRFEPFSYLHSKYFMKNELFDSSGKMKYVEIAEQALAFFSIYLPRDILSIVDTGEHSCDVIATIENEQFELGSYGLRSCEFIKWTYGTACAEPRLTSIKERYGISQSKN